MKRVGIDAGTKGALALLGPAGELLDVQDMPVVTIRINGGPRDRVDAASVAAILREWKPDEAVIEAVNPRKGDTPLTAGELCRASGIVEGVVAALGISVSFVQPMTWRKAAGVKLPAGSEYKDRKEASRQRALQTWPASAAKFARKLDADRAEAALIGRHG